MPSPTATTHTTTTEEGTRTMSTSELTQAAQRRATAGARKRFIRTLLVAGVWCLAIFGLYAVIFQVVATLTDAETSVSAFDTTLGATRWAVLGIGAGVTTAFLTPHIAAGGTRRSFFAGTSAAAVVAGAVWGAGTTVLLAGERALSTAFGIPWRRLFGLPVEPDSVAWYVVTAVSEGLVITTYTLLGIAIGLAYARFGWRGGTLTLIGLLVPAAIADLGSATGVFGSALALQAERGAAVPLGIAGGVVATVVAAVAYYLLLRDVRLRPPR